ncbi:protein of unknown function [Pseudomonas sp. JV551A1]|uniref:Uncharacterized protein n=1 Tax=Pseudomonas inefficax TaxID=2078786 RepID=A0AAQ1P884_9PSED|nr:protein of unknown function [Pseudomonas sp. JV551A1]SPO60433.1 protein of unknown function [Pseudomonas inefficax]
MMTMTMDPTIQGSGQLMLSAQRAPNAPIAGVAKIKKGLKGSRMIRLCFLSLGHARIGGSFLQAFQANAPAEVAVDYVWSVDFRQVCAGHYSFIVSRDCI